MSTVSNIAYTARTVNGIITLSDGIAQLQNGNLINVSNIETDAINTSSFSTNDFVVNTNIDLTANDSKIQFLYNNDPNNTRIDRMKIDTLTLKSNDINTNTADITTVNAINGYFSTVLTAPTVLNSDDSINVATTEWVKNQGYLTSAGTIPANIDCSSIVINTNITTSSDSVFKINCNNSDNNAVGFQVNRFSVSPAVSDRLLSIQANGNDSLGYDTAYARIRYEIDNPSNSSIEGGLYFDTNKSGSFQPRLHVGANQVNVLGVDNFLISSPLTTIQNGKITQSAIPTGQRNEFKASNFTELYLNGTEITAGLLIDPTLEEVLAQSNSAGNYDINMNTKDIFNIKNIKMDATSSIIGDTLDISANTSFNNAYYVGRLANINTFTVSSYNITFPLYHFYNFFQTGTTTDVYLPSLASLKVPQQTQITISKDTGSTLIIYPDAADNFKLPDGTNITSYTWNTATSLLILQCSIIAGGTWRIVYIESTGGSSTDTLGDVMARGNIASGDLNMNFQFINNCDTLGVIDINSNGLINSSRLYTENFTYTNMSSDIFIENWQAQTPTYVASTYYLQYSGSSTYTGTLGVITSGTSYNFYIVRGLNVAAFFVTYYPAGTTSTQCFAMQSSANNTFTFQTINYDLQAGQYIFGYWCQSQQAPGATINTYIKNSGGTILTQELGVYAGSSYPNWIFHTLAFTLVQPDTVYFQATSVARTIVTNILITGMELTQTNAIVIKDTVANKIATISGSQSILNALYVNDGLQVDSGGIDITGAISNQTQYGKLCLSINSPFGSLSSQTTSEDVLSIGTAVNQNGTTQSRVIAIGNSANKGVTTINDSISIGYNATTTTNSNYSICMGSNAQARGSSSIVISPNSLPQNAGVLGSSNVAVGTNIASNVYNGFGTLINCYQNVLIGHQAAYNFADRYCVAIGYQSLFNCNGRGGVTANSNNGRNTPYNVCVGFQSGYLRQQYTQCTFIGALADATVDNLTNATAIGYNTRVDLSNCIQLGSNGERVNISGNLFVNNINLTNINGLPYTGGGGGSQTLATTLAYGNSAGTYNIDMNNNSILNVGTIQQAQTLTTSPDISLQNTNEVASTGVLLKTTRLKAIGGLSTGDNLFKHETWGSNTAGTQVQYGLSEVEVVSSAVGAQEAKMRFSTYQVGALYPVCEMGTNFNILRPTVLSSGIQNAYRQITLSASDTYASVWGNYLGSHIFVAQSAAYTLTIGAASSFSGGMCVIENTSSYDLTVSLPSGIWLGSYGSGAITFVLYPGQLMSFSSNGITWHVNRVWGLPMTYRRIQNAVQTLTTASTTYVATFVYDDTQSIATTGGVYCWGGQRLGYTNGTFTNNTQYPMTVAVDAYVYFATGTTAKYCGWRLTNTTRTPYNRLVENVATASTTLNMGCSFQTTLAVGDGFEIIVKSAAANQAISSLTAANMSVITITRLG